MPPNTKVQPIEIPQPFEDTWSPCASSRGSSSFSPQFVLPSDTQSADFIGAYLQAKVIGRHFVKLPLEYAFHFPEYAKFFGKPLLLDKGIYGLVYSGKYWNIEFSEWLYSQGFIQSQSEPSYFVDMTNTTNGSASFSSLMICCMLAAMIPLKNNLKIPSKTA
ncbi:hypothetical protein MHU86_9161 [Fragilaria crotonensis]|nr:hypothetical protein MHU86_9161 [Fragilaria crotonensis]